MAHPDPEETIAGIDISGIEKAEFLIVLECQFIIFLVIIKVSSTENGFPCKLMARVIGAHLHECLGSLFNIAFLCKLGGFIIELLSGFNLVGVMGAAENER
jgi:hypothetical protein